MQNLNLKSVSLLFFFLFALLESIKVSAQMIEVPEMDSSHCYYFYQDLQPIDTAICDNCYKLRVYCYYSEENFKEHKEPVWFNEIYALKAYFESFLYIIDEAEKKCPCKN